MCFSTNDSELHCPRRPATRYATFVYRSVAAGFAPLFFNFFASASMFSFSMAWAIAPTTRPITIVTTIAIRARATVVENVFPACVPARSEEHTSELQSQSNLVCRLLLEKKKYDTQPHD